MYKFLSGSTGRSIRIYGGGILILLGVGSASWLFIAIGSIVLILGVLNICLLAPLFGKPLKK